MAKKKYSFRNTFGFNAKGLDPNAVGKELEGIRKGGDITPTRVIERARAEDSAMHSAFEWDDPTAAAGFRLVQARSLVRAMCVSESPDAEPTNAYYHVIVDDNPVYKPVAEVRKSVGLYESAKEQLLAELKSAQRSLRDLEAAAGPMGKRAESVARIREPLEAAIAAATQ